MPSAPGPRPDQIQQPAGTSIGDILSATPNGPAFLPPSALGATGPQGPQGPPGAGADLTGLDLSFSTGPVSHHIQLSSLTIGVSPPSPGLAGDIPINIYVNGEERGEKLEFIVPEDYASGNIALQATYRMSTSEAGIVALEANVSIADTLNGMVVTSTGPQIVSLDPIDATDFENQVVLQILEGTFSPGDVIVIDLKRLGDEPTVDTHGGDWEVVAFIYGYIGQVATRSTTQASEFFLATDEPAPPNGFLGAIPTSDYPSGADAEQKVSFIVPDNWDGLSDAEIKLTYAMSTAETATVNVETSGNIANVENGTLDVLGPVAFDIMPEVDTGPRRTVAIRSIDRLAMFVGDVITIKVARRTGLMGNHGGDFKLINIVMTTGQASGEITGTAPAASPSTTTFGHLGAGVFEFVSGTISSDTESPTVFGDFQAWDILSSTAPSGEINVAYEGRVNPLQSGITSINIPIKGTGNYALKVYVEGAITSNPVYDSGVQVAPVSRTVLALTGIDIPEQPISEGRYYVVVEAFVNTGENIRVGLPYVRQD